MSSEIPTSTAIDFMLFRRQFDQPVHLLSTRSTFDRLVG